MSEIVHMGSGDSGSHMLSENIWFVWFKTSSRGKVDVTIADKHTQTGCEGSAIISVTRRSRSDVGD